MNARTVVRVALFVTVAGVAIAVIVGASAPPGKSGERRTRTLTLAVASPADSRAGAVASMFARAVAKHAGGALRLSIVTGPDGATDPDDRADAAALADVRGGRADLAILPASWLAAAGVRSLSALAMPFLIDTDGGAAKVAADREVAAAVQVGLSRLALTGLGLVAEGLYRPFGYLKPLETPSDFRGIEIRAPRSAAIRTALRALDARPVPLGSVTAGAAVLAGYHQDGAAASSSSTFPQDVFTAANLAVLADIDVIVGSTRALGSLPVDLRRALTDAAGDTRRGAAAATAAGGDERSYCSAGGTVVNADASERWALQQATARALPGSRSLVLRIATLATGGSPACAGAIPAPFPRFEALTLRVRNRLLVPEGTYRHIVSAPLPEGRGGVATLSVTGEVTRHYHFVALAWQGQPAATCRGRIGLVDGENTIRWNPLTPCSGRLALRWQMDRGDLRIALDPRRSDRDWAAALDGAWVRPYPPG